MLRLEFFPLDISFAVRRVTRTCTLRRSRAPLLELHRPSFTHNPWGKHYPPDQHSCRRDVRRSFCVFFLFFIPFLRGKKQRDHSRPFILNAVVLRDKSSKLSRFFTSSFFLVIWRGASESTQGGGCFSSIRSGRNDGGRHRHGRAGGRDGGRTQGHRADCQPSMCHTDDTSAT